LSLATVDDMKAAVKQLDLKTGLIVTWLWGGLPLTFALSRADRFRAFSAH
jgi:hypothetical protein